MTFDLDTVFARNFVHIFMTGTSTCPVQILKISEWAFNNFGSSAGGNFEVTNKNCEKLTKMTLLNVEILQNKIQKKETYVF